MRASNRVASATCTRTSNRSRTRSRRSPPASMFYGAGEMFFYPEAERKITQFTRDGLATLPVCIAKTHLSLSADPALTNAPSGFTLPVRDLRAYSGAGWLVPLCGEITQMPGLGEAPAGIDVDIDRRGQTVGLF
jgi:formate--tetrahydrofolate ligase